MLWNEGRVGGSFDNSTQWDRLGRLMKSAINGIHGAAGDAPPKIIVHIDRGGDWGATRWFFDNLNQQNVPYDIIGQSFYPWWHGGLDDLTNCLHNTAERYGKPVVISETAYPWTDSQWDPETGLDIPASPEGQVEFVTELAKILKALPEGRGAGIFWWGSEYVQIDGHGLAGFQRRSFFDYDGNALPVVQAIGRLTSEVALQASLEGDALSLKWPISAVGMSLVTTTSPSPSAIWTTVTNAPSSGGGEIGVTVPLDGAAPQRFFRLEEN
jgi:arabinogalactan endo-1,4-beta-galactosidase